MSDHKLINSAVTVTVLAFVSKILGVIREVVLAAFFGASQVMDAFLMAFVIPDLLGTAVRSGITTAFIPVYNNYLAMDEKKKAETLVNAILGIILIVLVISGVIGFVFAPAIITFLAPGFSSELQALTVNLTQLLLPILFFSGIVGLMIGIQQAHHIFSYPALIYAVSNSIMIIMVIVFSAQVGIYAAVFAAVAGVILQLLIQWPGVVKCRQHFKLVVDFSHDGVKKIGVLIIPVLIGMTANSAYILVDRILASSLSLGSISALNYATKINAVFVGLFATPIITVMYPALAQHFARGDIESFKRHLNISIRIIAFIIIPVMSLLIAFRVPIVTVLFQRGAFDSQAVQSTAFALAFFAVGMLGMALLELLNQAFYAQQNTQIPVMVSVGIIAGNITLNFILIHPLAHGGLALATSISIIVGVLILLYILKVRIGGIGGWQIVRSIAKMIVAAGVMVIIGYQSFGIFEMTMMSYLQYEKWRLVLSLCFTLSICGAAYVLAGFFLRCEELLLIVTLLQKKLGFIAFFTQGMIQRWKFLRMTLGK